MTTSRSAVTASECANCGAVVASRFCGECGQATQVGRLHLHDLLHEVWHAFTHADQGILRVTKDLLLHPRQVYLSYFAGQRRKYFSPALYFLLAAGALALLYPLVFEYEDRANGMRNEFGRELSGLIKYIMLALLPIQVLLTWLVFRWRYNVAEITVFWLFCLGFTFLVRLTLLPLYYPLIAHKGTIDYAISLLVKGIIFWHLAAVFAQRSLWRLAYCALLIGLVNVCNYLLEGYLIYGSSLLGMLRQRGVGSLLRAVFAP